MSTTASSDATTKAKGSPDTDRAATNTSASAAWSIPLRVLVALVASIALSLVAFGIAAAAGATMLVITPGSPEPVQITALQVVVSLALPMLVVGALVWWLGRSRPMLVRWAAWIGLVVGVLSAGMPFSATSDLPTALALAAMHAIAGVVWFVALIVRPRR
jgi:hypothetical protein